MAEARLCASSSALILSAEIWALLKPPTVAESGDAESSPASAKAGPKLAACDGDEGDCDEVSDWSASSAASSTYSSIDQLVQSTAMPLGFNPFSVSV